MSAMTGIPSPLWAENKRLEAVIAELRRRVAELEAERMSLDEARVFCDKHNAAHSNAQLEAENARLRAELNAWETIPAEALITYWNAFGNDNDTVGEWINELRNGVNVGRYYAGLEPL